MVFGRCGKELQMVFIMKCIWRRRVFDGVRKVFENSMEVALEMSEGLLKNVLRFSVQLYMLSAEKVGKLYAGM